MGGAVQGTHTRDQRPHQLATTEVTNWCIWSPHGSSEAAASEAQWILKSTDFISINISLFSLSVYDCTVQVSVGKWGLDSHLVVLLLQYSTTDLAGKGTQPTPSMREQLTSELGVWSYKTIIPHKPTQSSTTSQQWKTKKKCNPTAPSDTYTQYAMKWADTATTN